MFAFLVVCQVLQCGTCVGHCTKNCLWLLSKFSETHKDGPSYRVYCGNLDPAVKYTFVSFSRFISRLFLLPYLSPFSLLPSLSPWPVFWLFSPLFPSVLAPHSPWPPSPLALLISLSPGHLSPCPPLCLSIPHSVHSLSTPLHPVLPDPLSVPSLLVPLSVPSLPIPISVHSLPAHLSLCSPLCPFCPCSHLCPLSPCPPLCPLSACPHLCPFSPCPSLSPSLSPLCLPPLCPSLLAPLCPSLPAPCFPSHSPLTVSSLQHESTMKFKIGCVFFLSRIHFVCNICCFQDMFRNLFKNYPIGWVTIKTGKPREGEAPKLWVDVIQCVCYCFSQTIWTVQNILSIYLSII